MGASLKKHGFEHRQGSGYISKERIDSIMVARIIESVTKEQVWLAECVRKIDVTDIGRQHDLTATVRELSEATNGLSEDNIEENISPTLTM